MVDLTDTFGFHVTAPDGSGDEPDLRERTVHLWLQHLPLADGAKSAEHISAFLERANRATVPASQRYRLLESIRAQTMQVAEGLEATMLGRSLPLTPKSLAVADQLTAMLQSLAGGYKRVVVDILAERGRYDKKLLTWALFRALRLLDRLLLGSYRLYAPHPRRLWQEAHLLYYYAESKKLSDLPLRDAGVPATDIVSAYKHIVLLALSDPYRLRQGEVEQLSRAAERWTELVNLQPVTPRSAPEAGYFYCRLNADIAPGSVTTAEPSAARYVRKVHLGRLVEALRSELARLHDGDVDIAVAGGLTYPLLRRLLLAWEQRTRRVFSRAVRSTNVELAVGLNTTHHLITRSSVTEESSVAEQEMTMTDDASSETYTQFTITPLLSELASYRKNTWVQSFPPTIHIVGLEETKEQPSPLPEPTYAAHHWQTINVSAGGYCLEWGQEQPSPAQVGELVGIREGEGALARWCIGVVRWMQYQKHQSVRLGVQVLAPHALALSARPARQSTNEKHTFSCLKLPAIKAIDQPPTLLMSALHHKVGDSIVIRENDRLTSVQLTRQTENTGNFARFQYVTVAEKPAEDTADGVLTPLGRLRVL